MRTFTVSQEASVRVSSLSAQVFFFALALGFITSAFALDANDAHWCRNGLFSSEPNITVMRVTGSERSPLRWDAGTQDGCPDADSCRHGYLLPGQEVLAGKSMGAFVCVYYQPSASAGWMLASALAAEPPPSTPTPSDWTGHWSVDAGEDSTIDITLDGAALAVDGEGYWPARDYEQGPGQPAQHEGGFSGRAAPTGGRLVLNDNGCETSMRRVGAYLVVTDNGQCGGANVRFDGVYTRTTARP